MRYGDFSRTKWISICCAARSSTAQPCDRSLNNFIRLGLGAVFALGPTTPTRFRDTGRDLSPCPQQGDMSSPRGETRTKHSPAQSDRSMSFSSILSPEIGNHQSSGCITLPVSCSKVSMSDWSW